MENRQVGKRRFHMDGGREMSEALSLILKLERERDEAKAKCAELQAGLDDIEEYGTEEINAAVDLRQQLAAALTERDWALKRVVVLEKQISGLNRFANERCEEILRVRKERDEAMSMAATEHRIALGLADDLELARTQLDKAKAATRATYFSFRPGYGMEFYEEADDARRDAAQHFSDASRQADEQPGWDEEEQDICWGKVLGRVEFTERKLKENECAPDWVEGDIVTDAELVCYDGVSEIDDPKSEVERLKQALAEAITAMSKHGLTRNALERERDEAEVDRQFADRAYADAIRERDEAREELRRTRKFLKDANRGAECNAKVNQIQAGRILGLIRERDEAIRELQVLLESITWQEKL